MKQLIKDVIELDQEAQKQIEKLKKQKEELFLAFKDIRKELTKENDAKINDELKSLEEKLSSEYKQNLAIIKKENSTMQKNIIDTFNNKKDAWIDELFEICIKMDV